MPNGRTRDAQACRSLGEELSAPGMTLLEVMMVLTLILILASFSLPVYRRIVVRRTPGAYGLAVGFRI